MQVSARPIRWRGDEGRRKMNGRVLIVAGSDSGGGAGIQADIKTVTCLGGFATTAVTALTAQNTQGVYGIVGVDPAFIRQQVDVVMDDIGSDAVKTGMLHNAEVIEIVAEALRTRCAGLPAVVDPVMVAQSGASLVDETAVDALKRSLLPLAGILTPNVPEAEKLTGMSIRDIDDQKAAAQMLVTLGAHAVLLKGGHMAGRVVSDVLAMPDSIDVFSSPRIDTRQTHGTGCTLASAIATGLAQRLSMRESVARARAYLQQALLTAPGYGKGQGPVNHGHTVRPFYE
jgi:hydroxymethylpyrimidine/phosphomethylpyrimidine kinase